MLATILLYITPRRCYWNTDVGVSGIEVVHLVLERQVFDAIEEDILHARRTLLYLRPAVAAESTENSAAATLWRSHHLRRHRAWDRKFVGLF